MTILPVGVLRIVEPSLANRQFVSRLAAVLLLTFLAKEEVAVIGANIGTAINAISSALLNSFISKFPGLIAMNQGLATSILTRSERGVHDAFSKINRPDFTYNKAFMSRSGKLWQ